jgi:hypothetical protein
MFDNGIRKSAVAAIIALLCACGTQANPGLEASIENCLWAHSSPATHNPNGAAEIARLLSEPDLASCLLFQLQGHSVQSKP